MTEPQARERKVGRSPVSEDGSAAGRADERGPAEEGADERRGWKAVKKWAPRVVPVVLLLVAMAHFTPRLIYSFSHESTDDAYVGGTIIPISPQVTGKVVQVYVGEHQPVAAGERLLEIDPTDYGNDVATRQAALHAARDRAVEVHASLEEAGRALAAARAKLGAARVQAELSRKERDRYANLSSAGAISRSQLDHVEATWQVDSAQVVAGEADAKRQEATLARLRAELELQADAITQAQTALESARVQLGRTVLAAPAAGIVAKKNVDPGQVVQPGAPLLAIVRTDSLYVDANFKETQIEKIRVGQPVEIDVDAYPGITFRGHVGSFQPGAGAVFSLLPPENATGNFVKVVRRIPVRIWFDSRPDPDHPLWPGLSAVPHVDTNAEAASGAVASSDRMEGAGQPSK